MRYLGKRLEQMQVIRELPADRGRVFFGAWVTLEDESGTELRYRIVGPDEFELRQGLISMDSPMARAVLGKRVDDTVQVATPTGTQEYTVIAIDYPGAGESQGSHHASSR